MQGFTHAAVDDLPTSFAFPWRGYDSGLMSYLLPLGVLLLMAASLFVWKVARYRGRWTR
jgi:hypothetical protein